ncbi:MAG: hypothetical protein WCT03_12700, partial [Candidatus Obscuribacterales bacterium]
MADTTEKDEKPVDKVVPKESTEKKPDVMEPVAAKDSSVKSGLGSDIAGTAVALKAHDAAVLKSTDVSELPKVEIGTGGSAVESAAAKPATKLVEVGKDGKRYMVEVPVEEPAVAARKSDASATTTDGVRVQTVTTGKDGVRTTTTVPVEVDTKAQTAVVGKDGAKTDDSAKADASVKSDTGVKTETVITGKDGIRTATEVPVQTVDGKTAATETGEHPTVIDRPAQINVGKDLDQPPISAVVGKDGLVVAPPPLMGSGGESSYTGDANLYVPPGAETFSEGTKSGVPVDQSLSAKQTNDQLIAEATARAIQNASLNKYDGSAPLTTGLDGKSVGRGSDALDPGLPPISKGDESFEPPVETVAATRDTFKADSVDASLAIPAKPKVQVESSKSVVVDVGSPPLSGDKSVGGQIPAEKPVSIPASDQVKAKPTPTIDNSAGVSVPTYDAMGNVTGFETTISPVPAKEVKVEDFTPPVATKDVILSSDKVERTLEAPTDVMGPVPVYPLRDAQGRVVATKDGLGQVANFNYGEDGKLTEIKSDMGNLKFNAESNSWEGTDKAGAAVSVKDLTIDNDGKLEMQFADGSHQTRLADGSTVVTKADSSRRELDTFGNTVKTVSASGEATSFKYDDKNQLVETVGPLGTFTKDAEGKWTGPIDKVSKIQVDPTDGSVLFDLGDGATLKRRVDGSRTEFDTDGSSRKYDTKGQLSEMWGSKGDYSSFKYDEQGNRTEMTLWQKDKATGKYGDQPQVFVAETPGGPLTDASKKYKSVDVDSKTGDVSYVLENGSKNIQHLDGRSDQVIGLEPNATKTFSDTAGNIVKVTGANGAETTYKYDANNKIVETNGPLGNYKQNADGTWAGPLGNVESINLRANDGSMAMVLKDGTKIDGAADGSRTEYVQDTVKRYDDKGQLSQMWAANGDYTAFKYDQDGNNTEINIYKLDKATGKYSDKPETFVAEWPGGPLTDSEYKYADVNFDAKTGDLTYYLPDGSKNLQHLDGRVDQTIGIEPNATKTYSDASGNIVRV